MSFHEVRFPTDISLNSIGGPERRTEVVALASGFEERNASWADSRRRYNAGYGIKSADEMHAVIAFYEERRGRLHGFRWKDWSDFKSCPPEADITPFDQVIGTGDGETAVFQLVKTYGSQFLPWTREIRKPVAGTVRIAVAGVELTEGWSVDVTTGVVTFDDAPAADFLVTAGFEFDVPVRFDSDRLELRLPFAGAGDIADIPIVEIRLKDL